MLNVNRNPLCHDLAAYTRAPDRATRSAPHIRARTFRNARFDRYTQLASSLATGVPSL